MTKATKADRCSGWILAAIAASVIAWTACGPGRVPPVQPLRATPAFPIFLHVVNRSRFPVTPSLKLVQPAALANVAIPAMALLPGQTVIVRFPTMPSAFVVEAHLNQPPYSLISTRSLTYGRDYGAATTVVYVTIN